ncbi:hypothetical protein WJX74_004249 [Apatococcus lobatus]|uniref:Uncharacterized protein n=1 Tax=Apatococcus lobatus TaxID=904363 RepID=A0AAW1RYE4_9CHLO
MFYGSTVWDPVLITAQIITMQCLFYASLGLTLWMFVGAAGAATSLPKGSKEASLTLATLFSWRTLSLHHFAGWLVALANVLNAVVASGFLMLVVERAKKCLDFAATLYIIHLAICSVFYGFPSGPEWWGVNVVAFLITAVLGEWLCLRREMQDIPIGSLRRRTHELLPKVSEINMGIRASSPTVVSLPATVRNVFGWRGQPPGAPLPQSRPASINTKERLSESISSNV